jgi:hypothetical protein
MLHTRDTRCSSTSSRARGAGGARRPAMELSGCAVPAEMRALCACLFAAMHAVKP